MKKSLKCLMVLFISLAMALSLMPIGSTTAYAAGTWTVTFDSQGGDENPDPITVADGTVIGWDNCPYDPSREGYFFNGWYTDPACTTYWDMGIDLVTHDMTLYTDWSPVEHNSDGFYYYDNFFSGGYSITGYDGTNPDVVVPGFINSKRVYELSPGSLSGNTTITSITFPPLTAAELGSTGISLNWVCLADCPNLTLVDLSSSGQISEFPKELFYNDINLETITCSADNPFHTFVDGVLFNKDVSVLCVYPPAKHTLNETYDIPGTVTTIRGTAFQSCQYIEIINIPASVTSIDFAAFSYCPQLTQINVVPENTAFSSDSGVLFNEAKTELVAYPGGKTNDADGYVIPSTVERIKNRAFEVAYNLTKITIPASVTDLGTDNYSDGNLSNPFPCPNLTEIIIEPGSQIGNLLDGVLFNTEQTILLTYPADRDAGGSSSSGFSADTSGFIKTSSTEGDYVVPDDVETIVDYSFYGCKLSTVTIPDSVTEIGRFAFFGNKGVTIKANNHSYAQDYAYNTGIPFYSLNGYDVSFDSSGGSAVPQQNVAQNGKAIKPAAPSLEGYDFVGWYDYDDSGDEWNFNTAIDHNLQLYAEWNAWSPVGLTLQKTDSTTHSGTNGTITATASGGKGQGYEYSINGGASWQSSNCFTGLGAGSYTVIVRDVSSVLNDVSASVVIGQPAPAQVGISCTKTDASVYGGTDGSVTVTASGGNSGSYEYSINGGASWQSSNVFGGLSVGTYTAAVRDAGYTSNMATCGVTVGQPSHIGNVPAKKISSKANAGTAITVVAPAAPKGYTVVSTTYTSTNPSVATVDSNGNVTFLAGGKATIITKIVSTMVDSKGKVKTKTTTVKKSITVKQPIASISLNLNDTTIARTQKVKLTAALAPTTASNKKVTWKSNNPKVAAVSSSGVVTGKAGGTAVITCTAKDGSGASASCIVNVTPIYPTSVKLSKAALTLKTGKTASLKATITPKNTDFKTVTWASSNQAIATVDAKGKIKAIAPGTAVITVTTSSGQTASCPVTVK